MFGLNIDPRNSKGNPDPAELYELGVELVRFTYADPRGGDQLDAGQLQFYKKKVQDFKQVGITSLLILNYETYPNKPSHNAGDGEWDSYNDRLAHRCGQIAREFAAWTPAFQIWNEPDHPPKPGYAPTVREAVFGRMLNKCNSAIKAVNAGSFVIAGGLATGNPSWLQRVVQSQGGNLPADAIAFHPYGQRPEHNWPRPDWLFGYVGNLLNNYFQAGGGKPIWITEMGIKEQDINNNRDQAAEFLRRYYRTITTHFASKVHHLIWFCYSDGMVPTFGLTDAAGNRKPIYNAFKQSAPQRPPLQPVIQPPTPPVITQPGSGMSTPSPSLNLLHQQAIEWQTQAQELQTQLSLFQTQLQQFIDQQGGGPSQPTTGVTPGMPVPAKPAPPMQNITNQLKKAPDKQFPTRSLNQIQKIVIHHTAIVPTVGAERIAQHRVDNQDWPGIGYHYFITGDGIIQQTNELTTLSTHAGQYNPVAIGVCFAGDFTQVAPTPIQIESGAQLIAWLMSQFGLPITDVNGYKELVVTQSPGQQWDTGLRWGDQLKQRIQAYL